MKDIEVIQIDKTFYTVIGIKVDAFESIIQYERHFRGQHAAKEYAAHLRKKGLYTIVAQI